MNINVICAPPTYPPGTSMSPSTDLCLTLAILFLANDLNMQFELSELWFSSKIQCTVVNEVMKVSRQWSIASVASVPSNTQCFLNLVRRKGLRWGLYVSIC